MLMRKTDVFITRKLFSFFLFFIPLFFFFFENGISKIIEREKIDFLLLFKCLT